MIEGHGGMLDRLDSRDLRRADLLSPDALLVDRVTARAFASAGTAGAGAPQSYPRCAP